MQDKNELVGIIKKFAASGWGMIEKPCQAFLEAEEGSMKQKLLKTGLIAVIEKADKECGSCGCELDPLYKRALELLRA